MPAERFAQFAARAGRVGTGNRFGMVDEWDNREEEAMVSKSRLRMVIAAACVMLAAGWGSVGAGEVPVVNGKHWTESSEAAKKAYLIGIANLADVELAYGANDARPDAASVIPRLVKGLKGQTLDSVRQTLDRWYAANPDKLQRPVLETIWFELVVPGLRNAK